MRTNRGDVWGWTLYVGRWGASISRHAVRNAVRDAFRVQGFPAGRYLWRVEGFRWMLPTTGVYSYASLAHALWYAHKAGLRERRRRQRRAAGRLLDHELRAAYVQRDDQSWPTI